jgi:hypothetical protein
MHGFSRFAIPDDGCFTLVCDADGGNLFAFDFRRRDRVADALELDFENLFRIMFDPTWFWEKLREFMLSDADCFSLTVENNRATTSGARINAENVSAHSPAPAALCLLPAVRGIC